jgi:predicted amidohydrolase
MDYKNRPSNIIALGQLCSTSNIDHNFSQCEWLAERAKQSNAKMLCLPECFAYMAEQEGDAYKNSEHLHDGKNLARYKELAKRFGLWMSLGGFHERSETEGKVFNSHLILNEHGEIVSVYRKIHMFKVTIANGPNLDENKSTQAGDQLVLVDTPLGKLGLTTCYDLRFPELYLALAKSGAQIILVPSAFTLMTGKAHWEPLLRARAIENQVYMVAAAQVGTHNPKRVSFGHSLVVDPWGTIVGNASDKYPELVLADLDLSYIEQVRESIPVNTHRKPHVYGEILTANKTK